MSNAFGIAFIIYVVGIVALTFGLIERVLYLIDSLRDNE
jgi:hypothetical protein